MNAQIRCRRDIRLYRNRDVCTYRDRDIRPLTGLAPAHYIGAARRSFCTLMLNREPCMGSNLRMNRRLTKRYDEWMVIQHYSTATQYAYRKTLFGFC
jgi:hypothetical protein